MKYLYNFKIFERKITINFPDNILLDEFKELLEFYFKNEMIENKEKLIDELVTKFAEDIIDDFLYSSGQGAKSPELYMVLPGADGTDDEVKDTISQLLSKNEYIEIIAKDNKTYLDSKKYNL